MDGSEQILGDLIFVDYGVGLSGLSNRISEDTCGYVTDGRPSVLSLDVL